MVTRRTIIGGAAGIAGAAAAGTALAQAPALPDRPFVHHVYFWLKDPGDPQALIAGLRRLAAAPDILWSHIGLPAQSERGVVDDSYSVSWLAFFVDKAAEDRYQVDPIHLKFVEDCSALWERVIVYDTQPAAA